jgi:ASC-1-like (ASCH) protein
MNYNLNLNDRPFLAIKAGTKKIEGRVKTSRNTFLYSDLLVGDTITFTNKTTNEKMLVDVSGVRHYPNTREMLEAEGVENVLSSDMDIEGGIESYNSFSEYKENIPKYGIWAIEMKCR